MTSNQSGILFKTISGQLLQISRGTSCRFLAGYVSTATQWPSGVPVPVPGGLVGAEIGACCTVTFQSGKLLAVVLAIAGTSMTAMAHVGTGTCRTPAALTEQDGCCGGGHPEISRVLREQPVAL